MNRRGFFGAVAAAAVAPALPPVMSEENGPGKLSIAVPIDAYTYRLRCYESFVAMAPGWGGRVSLV